MPGGISQNQQHLLVELVSADPELMMGKFTSAFTFAVSRRRWSEIADKLNAIGGGNKDFKQWRKTWQDLRCKAKSKSLMNKKHAAGTGGGPPVPAASLNATDELILQLISHVSISGHTGTSESVVDFDFSSLGGTQPEAGCSSWQTPERVVAPSRLEASPPLRATPSLEEPITLDTSPIQTRRPNTATRRMVETLNVSKKMVELGEQANFNQAIFYKDLLALQTRQTVAAKRNNNILKELLNVLVKLLEELKDKFNI